MSSNPFVDFHRFSEPDFLSRLGRTFLDDLVAPFSEGLQKAGVKLPNPTLEDSRYFAEMSLLLRAEPNSLNGLKAKVELFLDDVRHSLAAYSKQLRKEFLKRHMIVALEWKRNGRGLLATVAGAFGMFQDYPDEMTPEQADIVGSIMDCLRDYADCYDDIEPGDLMKHEQELSRKLAELERTGLALFAGSYTGRKTWPATVVLVAHADDPRIKRNAAGKQYLQGAIPKNQMPKAGLEKHKPKAGSVKQMKKSDAEAGSLTGAQKVEIHKVAPENAPQTQTIGERTIAGANLVFRKTGRLWKVVLDGAPELYIEDTLGARYLDYLLHHPAEAISAYDLEVTITPQKAKVRTKNTIQRDLDADTIRSYLREVEQLRAKHDHAVEEGRQNEVDRLADDIDQIEAVLKKGGIAADTGERARGNVSKAIAAVRGKLLKGDKYEKALGIHIKKCVSMGYTFRYTHPTGGVWQ